MRSLDSWRRIPPARRAMLPTALAAVALVRAGLRFVPLPAWERMADRLSAVRSAHSTAAATAQDVAWAVRTAGRLIPRASCLTQALAAKLILSRRGYASRLGIGVARGPAHGLRAHAWLEVNGLVVVGGSSVEEFTPLLVMPTEHPAKRPATPVSRGKLHYLPGEAR